MIYEPLADRVFIREIEESKTTSSGLWIPDVARKTKGVSFGEVIWVGPGVRNTNGDLIPCYVQPGDVVAFPSQAPATLPIMNESGAEEDVLMCRQGDIIAKVRGLPRATTLVDRTGAPLSINPSSLALADSVYENREGIDRAVSDLKNAPPDVIADVKETNDDERSDIDEGSGGSARA